MSAEETFAMRHLMTVDERCIYFAFKFVGVMELPPFENLMQSSSDNHSWCRWIEMASLRAIYPDKAALISNMNSALVHCFKRSPEQAILLAAVGKVILARFHTPLIKNKISNTDVCGKNYGV